MGKRWVSIGVVLVFGCAVQAQSTQQPVESTANEAPVVPTTETLDAGESLLFMGKKLWFETRKRLNLATDEEVKEQAMEEKKVRLKVGAFKIEK